MVISELNTWPVSTPVNASPASLQTQAHDSEPRWCATPFLCGSLIRYSLPVYPGAFLDHLVRSPQHVGWNREADLLGRFQIDDEFKLRWLLDREITRFSAFQNLVDIRNAAALQVGDVRAVAHKPAVFHIAAFRVYRREPALYGMLGQQGSLRKRPRTP